MPRAPLRFLCLCLCLWLCSEAVASQHWQKTKATFSPLHESTAAADRNAQSRRWRTVSGQHNAGIRDASAQASWLDTVNRSLSEPPRTERHRSAVRKSDAQNGTGRIRVERLLRTDGDAASRRRGGGCGPGEVLKRTGRGPSCSPGRSGQHRRRRRSAKQSEPPPAALAQEQDAPLGLNSSDYEEPEEEYSLPDFPEPTPFGPVNTRTRRKQVRNPFYPLTAEAYGAYAVMIVAAVIFAVGIVGNVSVMCIVCHNYYMRSISNSLLANLALWDFVIIFFCLPLVVFHELTKNWLLGEFSCRIIPYLEVSTDALWVGRRCNVRGSFSMPTQVCVCVQKVCVLRCPQCGHRSWFDPIRLQKNKDSTC